MVYDTCPGTSRPSTRDLPITLREWRYFTVDSKQIHLRQHGPSLWEKWAAIKHDVYKKYQTEKAKWKREKGDPYRRRPTGT